MKKETAPLQVSPNANARMQEIYREAAGKSESKQAGGNEGAREGGREDGREPESEDWREAVRESARKAGSGPVRTTRLNADVDEALHTRLRIHCMEQGLRLKELIPALLAAYLEEG